MVPWPDHHRVMPGHPNSHLHGDRSTQPMDFGSDACPLVHPSHPCVVELEQRGSCRRCSVLHGHQLLHLGIAPVVLLAFTKAFKRKGKLCSFFLFFLSACPCVLLPRCGELLRCVCAAQRKPSGCGAAAPSGNCSYQTGFCQKGIIIIKPLMVSREIRRYSCSRGLTCSSQRFLNLYREF